VDVDNRGVVASTVADVVDRDGHVVGNLTLDTAAEGPRVAETAIAVDNRTGGRVVDHAAGQHLVAQPVQSRAARRANDSLASGLPGHGIEAGGCRRIRTDRERAGR